MNEYDQEKLVSILDNGNGEDIIAYFDTMSEKDRQTLAPVVSEWLRKNKNIIKEEQANLHKNWVKIREDCISENNDKFDFPYFYAYFSTMNLTDLKSSKARSFFSSLNGGSEIVVLALSACRPEWIGPWLEFRMSKERSAGEWLLYRTCVRKRLCPRTVNEPTVFCMLRYFSECAESPRYSEKEAEEWRDTRFAELCPEFLDEEIRYVFEHEFNPVFPFGGIDLQIACGEKNKNKLKKAFLAMVRDKYIDRSLFLDLTLKPMSFSYKEGELRWYVDLHRQLKPDPDEIAKRQTEYVRLLKSVSPSVNGLAYDMLTAGLKAKKIDPDFFFENISSVFQWKQKGRSLDLLAEASKMFADDPTLRQIVLDCALAGLHHSAADVQSKAADLFIASANVEKVPELLNDVERLLPGLAASVQKKLTSLLKKGKINKPGDKK